MIRERNEDFVMIKQHDHAQVSKKLYQQLHEYLYPLDYNSSIEYAIAQHDCGWIPFDEVPFWDDKDNSPFSFTNYPIEPKTVLYKYGIEVVEERDSYAALLCSEHYTRFLENNSNEMAKQFVQKEKARQKNLKAKLSVTEELFSSHYEILQFFDNLSLYICLNEPGTTKKKEHHFFKKGIHLPSTFTDDKTLNPIWENTETIELGEDLFTTPVSINVKQRKVLKKEIIAKGLQMAYSQAKTENMSIGINNI